MTEQTITNLRRMVRGLRPIYLEDLGLSAALEMLAKETSATGGLEVDYASTTASRNDWRLRLNWRCTAWLRKR